MRSNRLDQYLGIWAVQIDRAPLGNLAQTLHTAAARGVSPRGLSLFDLLEPEMEYTREGSVAVIELSGVLTKESDWLFGGTSTAQAREALSKALADPEAKTILLKIDSPGGTLAGLDDFASDIANAKAQKPVVAYIEDLGASAAYWAASQCDEIHANQSAAVGSIGAYMVVYDTSAAFAQAGIKTHVFRTGEFKGAGGIMGDELTEVQAEEFQKHIETYFSLFADAVKRGRGMSQEKLSAVSDGRVFIGSEAKRLGLIDGITGYRELLARLNDNPAIGGGNSRKGEKAMAELEATVKIEAVESPKPEASQSESAYEAIKAACPGADAEFLCAAMEGKLTAEQARDKWIEKLQAESATAKAERDAALESLAALRAEGIGNKPVETAVNEVSDAGTLSAKEQWNKAIQEKVSGGMSKAAAIAKLAKDNPDLHAAYLNEVNGK